MTYDFRFCKILSYSTYILAEDFKNEAGQTAAKFVLPLLKDDQIHSRISVCENL